ncbi:MAG: hypothetical protein E7456_06715 [Ruminococcaceae bacterium]|nr:hypothetical protein [Oscillospiraceae bacterium]
MEPNTPNEAMPAGICDRCKGEVYAEELVHLIDGFVICAECFPDFAYDYFEPDMVLGGDLKEMLCTYDDD